MIASDHPIASQTSFPAGVPTKSARAALTIVVNGLCSAIGCSHDGIDSTGTNAEDTNVSGNNTVNPNAFAASGDDAVSPMKAKTHENAYPIRSRSRIPATISGTLVAKRKPTARPTPIITTSCTTFVTTSASVRPVTTAERLIGSERKRSTRPFFRSSESPRAVTNPPNTIDWTMIPGMRKST